MSANFQTRSIDLNQPETDIPEHCRNLPAPRIWTPQHLADFIGFGIHWVYKQTKKSSEDPPPRCQGIKQIRFDTYDPEFQRWLARQLRSH